MQANPISADSASMPRRARFSCGSAVFAKQCPPEEVEAIAAHLQKNGTLTIPEAGKASYVEG